MEMTEKKIKVSVCVVTYNQEKYIYQCLQSIVDQEVDFEIEVIVGDDCSTDRTPEIIANFANKYPLIIKNNRQCFNVGPFKNQIDICSKAQGDYIAHCDGDDYWLPGKLKAQILFLEKNKNVSGVFTNAMTSRGLTNPVSDSLVEVENTLKTIFTKSPFVRSSFVERRYSVEAIEQYFLKNNKIFDFEWYFINHRGGELMIMGAPYVYYSTNPDGISKSPKILNEYLCAIERLGNHGLCESAHKAMIVDFDVSKYLTDPCINNQIDVRRYLSTKNKKIFVLIKLMLPHYILNILTRVKRKIY